MFLAVGMCVYNIWDKTSHHLSQVFFHNVFYFDNGCLTEEAFLLNKHLVIYTRPGKKAEYKLDITSYMSCHFV